MNDLILFIVKSLVSLGGGAGKGIREPLLTCSSFMCTSRHDKSLTRDFFSVNYALNNWA